jgi:hypothetical protein
MNFYLSIFFSILLNKKIYVKKKSNHLQLWWHKHRCNLQKIAYIYLLLSCVCVCVCVFFCVQRKNTNIYQSTNLLNFSSFLSSQKQIKQMRGRELVVFVLFFEINFSLASTTTKNNTHPIAHKS